MVSPSVSRADVRFVHGDGSPRTRQRVQPGSIRLLIDTADGPITTTGQLIDLSEGGCALRLHRPMAAHLAGRVNVDVAGTAMWLPVVSRWVRADAGGWTVGCEFDRPTPEKQCAIRTLLRERLRLPRGKPS